MCQKSRRDISRARSRLRREGAAAAGGGGRPLSVVLLIVGSASCIVGLTLMALGYRVSLVRRDYGVITASVGLWAVDFGFNFADVAVRAITAGALPKEHQAVGNAYAASALGAGQVAGFAVGALPLAGVVESVLGVEKAIDFEGQVAIGVVLLIATLACSLWTMTANAPSGGSMLLDGGGVCGEDDAQDAAADDGGESADDVGDELTPILGHGEGKGAAAAAARPPPRSRLLRVIWDSYNLMGSPPKFYRIAAMTSLMYLAFFPSLYFTVDFVATEVFGGVAANPDGSSVNDDRYDRGVRFANLFLGLNSLVMTVCARTLIPLVPHLGYLWTAGAGSLSVLVLLFASVRRNQRVLAALCITGFGIPFSILSALPYALISIYCRGDPTKRDGGRDAVGSLMGKVNLYIIGPSFLVWGCVYVLLPLGVTVRALIGSGCLVAALAVLFGHVALRMLK